MENELLNCLYEIENVKKYLIKKGKSRYQGKCIQNKLAETEIIFHKSKELINLLSAKEDLSPTNLETINSVSTRIKIIYDTILELCKTDSSSSSEYEYMESDESKNLTMEFDLKTACNLIPVMNNNENNTKLMIDSVEMYSEMLSDSGKKLLVTFVLKSRLSENAKLRLATTYQSANDLVRDLRQHLLTNHLQLFSLDYRI